MPKSTRKTTNLLTMPRPVSTTAEPNPPMNPTESEIARRAFELYCARGCQDGYDVEDWLRAERELQQTANSTAA